MNQLQNKSIAEQNKSLVEQMTENDKATIPNDHSKVKISILLA